MTEKIYTLIDMELEKAKRKHPVFPFSPVERCSIMIEEAGEAVQAANDMFFGEINDATQKELLRTELLHTACVCVRILEAMEKEEKENEKARTID